MSGFGMLEAFTTERQPRMPETLTMSKKETERLKVLSRIEHKELTVAEAAESLDLSERQMYRILRRYQSDGEQGLIHRLRGTKSNTSYEPEVRTKAMRLYREQYADYGPTLFAEKLELYHDLPVPRQTLTRWLTQESLWAGTRKKRPHRKKRQRRCCIGSLIQFDGSQHDWFEGRGPARCLLVAIDDASGRVMLRFRPTEDTQGVLGFWNDYIERYGIPAEIYIDFGSVYHDNNGKKRLTQFGRAMTALGIKLIYAHSPQAKGRVERSNRTHQDRLIKALREHNISSIEEANSFLDNFYTDDHNQRFALKESLTDIHRCAAGIDLKNIFCLEEIRHVYNDWTITLDAQFIQLLRSEAPLPPPRAKVVLRRWLDGSLHIFWNEHELAFKQLVTKPKRAALSPRPPASNHPWRTKPVGGITAQRHKEKTLASKQSISYDTAPASTKRRKGSTRYARSAFPSNNASS